MWKSVGKTGLSPLSTVSATEETWQRNLEAATIVDKCLKEAFFSVLSFFKIFILQPELINDCLSPSMSKVKYVEWLLVKVPTYRLSELSAISEESLRKEWLSLVCGQRSQVNRIESLCQEVRILGHFATQEFVGLSPWMVHFFFFFLYLSELYLWQTT